jgi:hypothetical protein
MSNINEIIKCLESTLRTKDKKIKLKLDFNGSAREEKYFKLKQYTLSTEEGILKLLVEERESNVVHQVIYNEIDIEEINYYDNDTNFKIWVYFNDEKPTQRFYLYYK